MGEEGLLERVVERGHRLAARARVKRHGGRPGGDGMTVAGVPGYVREPGPQSRAARVAGTAQPPPVKRVASPQPGGGGRTLGVPPVLDRVIQPAVLQVLPPEGDTTLAARRAGGRPGRWAHQAVAPAPQYRGEGDGGVVALDVEKCVDRVNHDTLRSGVKQRGADRRVWQRIDRDLKAGARTAAGLEATGAGPPPGGPVSPLLANLLRDGLDKALERRGHRFVCDADACPLSVTSVRAGQRVRARVPRFLERRLKWAVTAAQRAVDRPWRRTFLGFTCTGRRPTRRRVRDTALQAGQAEGRRRTFRRRGESRVRVGGDRRRDRAGGYTYVGFAEAPSRVKERDSWRRRRLRCDLWQPWDRRRDRPLRRRGVSRDLAWNTGQSAHGPWRLSRRPALAIALPGSAVDGLGVPRLPRGSPR